MDNPTIPPPDNLQPEPKKRRPFLWLAIVAIAFAGGIFAFVHYTHKPGQPVLPAKPEPAFHRDEPTEKQIFQDDYKKKVKEMLDSGNSVMEVSKQTKIRKDEVRKIKKEMSKEKQEQ